MVYLDKAERFQYISDRTELSYSLKKFREDLNLTQQQVSDALSIHRSTYAYYETGKTLPDIFNLIKISKVFCVDIYYLIIKDGHELYRRGIKIL